jgi:hypothetical protein
MWQQNGEAENENFETVRDDFYKMTSHTFQTECKGKQ